MDKVRVFLKEAVVILILIAVLVSQLRPVVKDYLASRSRRLIAMIQRADAKVWRA
jgi:hypothetical protein